MQRPADARRVGYVDIHAARELQQLVGEFPALQRQLLEEVLQRGSRRRVGRSAETLLRIPAYGNYVFDSGVVQHSNRDAPQAAQVRPIRYPGAAVERRGVTFHPFPWGTRQNEQTANISGFG